MTMICVLLLWSAVRAEVTDADSVLPVAGMEAVQPVFDADTTGMRIEHDSAYVAQQTAEIEMLLAQMRLNEQLDSIKATMPQPTPRFSVRQAILPAALLAVGAAAVWEPHLKQARNYVGEQLEGSHTNADKYIQWAPLALNVTLKLCGVKNRYSNTDNMLATLTSLAIVYGVGYGLGYAIGEESPDGKHRHSFPSLRVARSFRSAEMIRMRYGNWWGLGGYALATTVAYLRMRNGKDWVNDVIGGAALGILSARIGYWLVPLEKKLFNLKEISIFNRRYKLNVAAVPYYDAEHRGVGAMVAIEM